eukprot:g2196.t1
MQVWHSQIWQDKILNSLFFKHRRKGIFVDVGASDPVVLSNSLYFERELDWSGLCLEANPDYANRLQLARSCRTINTCVSNASAVHNFTMGGMLGGIDSQDKDQRHQTRLAQEALPSHVVEVECNTLSSIFDQHQLRVVDFLSVDVEGMDLQVLQGINFERVHINVLSVECLYKDTEVPELDNFLYSRGFRRVLRLSFDCVYANEVLRFSWAAADDSTSHQGHQGHKRQRPSIAVPLDLA